MQKGQTQINFGQSSSGIGDRQLSFSDPTQVPAEMANSQQYHEVTSQNDAAAIHL